MVWEYECPRCKLVFEITVWENGYCPGCGNSYGWDEQCTEDYSDCWEILLWDHYS